MASGKVIERPQVVLFQDAQGISRLVEAEEADIVCLQVGASVDVHGRATGAIACCTLESCECEAGDKAEGQRCGGLRENPATKAAGVALLLEQLDSEEGLLRRGHTVQVCVSGVTLSSSEILENHKNAGLVHLFLYGYSCMMLNDRLQNTIHSVCCGGLTLETNPACMLTGQSRWQSARA